MPEKIAFADFETEGFQPRPIYPPKPVGLALLVGREKEYHRCRSPSEISKCKRMLLTLIRDGYQLCFHHASFDLDVMETHLGIAWPAYWHDTLLLAYLDSPRSWTFELKPLAEKHLGEKPDERDKLKEWILENVEKATAKTWGGFISYAPYEIVRPYAIGDVTRTRGLFEKFFKVIGKDKRMSAAYARELKVTRVLIKMERRGVPVDVKRLKPHLASWRVQKAALEERLFKDLKVQKKQRDEFKWAGKNFAHQIVKSGMVDELPKTKKGNDSTAGDALAQILPKGVANRLELRSQLQTCIVTFGEAWLTQAQTGGRFYARYNQVRQNSEDGKMVGTSTGRLSMTPNLQNVIRSDKGDLVPRLRKYLAPKSGFTWLKRDYSQQEMRIFAHYEEGEMLDRYLSNPRVDAHILCRDLIHERSGIFLERRPVKDINFGVLYGMGRVKLAAKLQLDLPTAINLLKAYHKAIPGVKKLQGLLSRLADDDEPLYTWGGRRYYCEPPAVIEEVVDGVLRRKKITFEYKMLNTLVQGGAADITKEAMVRYDETGWNDDDKGPLALQVHDELNALAQNRHAKEAMKVLREAMESIELDVPLLSDGSASRESWDACAEVDW